MCTDLAHLVFLVTDFSFFFLDSSWDRAEAFDVDFCFNTGLVFSVDSLDLRNGVSGSEAG